MGDRTLWWALLLAGCAGSFQSVEMKSLPTAADFPDADAVVLSDEVTVVFRPGTDGLPEAIETERVRLRSLKPMVLEPLTTSYSHTFSEVLQVRARITGPDGRNVPIDFDAKSDRPSFEGSVLYSDSRVIHVPLPAMPVGAVYEREIVTRYRDPRPHVFSQSFAGGWPVKRATLDLIAPREWLVRWAPAGVGTAIEPSVQAEGSTTRWHFELKDQPALPDEPDQPAGWALVPMVSARLERWTIDGKTSQAFTSPEALSAWLATEYARRATATPELRATVASVLQNVEPTPEARARALYEHACRTVDYCAIEIGYGGWIPHDAGDVQRLKYGDCKDKATYLHTLLREAGISSAPTLIYAHHGTPRPFTLPSLGTNFNHAILAVDLPQGVVYADPTQRVVPFGQLAPSDQGATVLPLRPDGAELATTPESTPSDNLERQEATLDVDSRGHARGTVRVVSHGAAAIPTRSRVLGGRALLDTWLADRLWLRNPAVSQAQPREVHDFSDEAVMEAEVELRQLTVTSASGDALVRPFDVVTRWSRTWPKQRPTAVVTRFTTRREQRVQLTLPPGTQVLELPAPVEVVSPLGTYRLTWSAKREVLTLERSLELPRRVLKKDDLGAFNALASRIDAAEHAAALVRLPWGANR